jgi:lipopolysaccharide transport system permease protein
MIWRNVLILGHNLMIIPLVFLAVGKSLSVVAFISIPGFVLAVINLAWVALILAILCARYRDLPQIVGSVLQVFFYLTPIMWMPSLLPQRAGLYLLDLNPIFHLLEIVRAPLLGQLPNMTSWMVSSSLALIGWGLTLAIYGRYKRRIAYWL